MRRHFWALVAVALAAVGLAFPTGATAVGLPEIPLSGLASPLVAEPGSEITITIPGGTSFVDGSQLSVLSWGLTTSPGLRVREISANGNSCEITDRRGELHITCQAPRFGDTMATGGSVVLYASTTGSHRIRYGAYLSSAFGSLTYEYAADGSDTITVTPDATHRIGLDADTCRVVDSLTAGLGYPSREATVFATTDLTLRAAAAGQAGAIDPATLPTGTGCQIDVPVSADFGAQAAAWSLTPEQYARFAVGLTVAVVRFILRA